MRRIAWAIGVLVLAGAIAAAVMLVGSKPGMAKESTEPVDPKLVTAGTAFGFNLLNELMKEEPGKNVFISPASVSLALSMTYNGASGTTKDAMAKALQVQGLSLDELNKANSALMSNLEGPGPKVEIRVANSLWAKTGVPFRDDFMQRNRKFYRAEITDLNLQSSSAKDAMNAWVKEKTNGKIPEIVKTVDPLAIMFLINAVYFKGEWTDKFDEKLTHDAPFTLTDGRTKTVRMMTRDDEHLRCNQEDDFQAVSLPYGKGRLSMYVFLPRKGLRLSEFTKQLTASNWDKWMRGFAEKDGSISIPRFKIEYTAELKQALTALGMGIAFRGIADFTAMTPLRPAYIWRVRHRTFVEVNEKGTEAAAATSVEMVGKAVTMDRFEMVVDRPFIIAIRDNNTGAILFLGAITEP